MKTKETPESIQLDDRRSLIMSEIMTPDTANFQGNVHGGYLLMLLDRVAYACASRFSGNFIVTLSVDQVIFKEPIHVGELVFIQASVNYVGHTSLEVGMRVIAENLYTHERRHTNTSYFTMVAVDEKGKPTKLPPLTIETDVQKRRFEAALKRRDIRLQQKQK